MKNIFAIFFLITISILSTDLKAEAKQVPNKDSKIILHDGFFGNGLPNRFYIDLSKKNGRWGYGNWESSQGYANIGFSQTGQGRIILETGMLPKKILKSWSVENYKLGKKKGFKSSGNRALVQLVDINNKKCVVIISRFGPSGGDAQNRLRSTVDGYICKNSGEISIDEGINFMHCTELKGEGTNFIGRNIDDKCDKKNTEKKIEKESSSTSTTSVSTSSTSSTKNYIDLKADSIKDICKYLDCWNEFKDDYLDYFKFKNNKAWAIAYNKKITNYISSYGWKTGESNITYAKNKALDVCNQHKDKSDKCFILFENNKIVNQDLIKLLSNKSIQKNNKDSFEERLKKLKSLYDQNLITKEDYDIRRKEILDEM